MPATTQPPLSRRLQALGMKAFNVPMRRILELPFGTPLGSRLMVAYIVGRKTGHLYRQPLSYVRDGETLLTPGGGAWRHNLRPDQPVRLRISGRDVLATPEVVTDPDAVESLLDILTMVNPTAGRYLGVGRDDEGRINRQQLNAAMEQGLVIVRWHLNGAAA